ncbi:beta-ketoacyl-ACP synthase [Baaleninema sp.]|uniref:beta-ketoacyl-ACP synthase n=1 Tax=Baaleninema sp. TaxID=3101197 RepID=UPI003D0840C5
MSDVQFDIDVVVTGIGARSSLGNLATTWMQLISGKSGLQMSQPFPELSSKPLGLLGDRPADFLDLAKTVVVEAIDDADLSPSDLSFSDRSVPTPLRDCGVVLGSSRSQQGRWEFLNRQMQTDTLSGWLQALPHMGAIAIARFLKTQGPVLAPMAACATGIWAIAQGVQLIRSRQCDRVLAGAVETPITPLTLASFDKMGALAKTGCYPFDRHREGLALAEGAALFVLESAAVARQRNAKIYGRILDFGLTADSYHVSAPQPESRGAISAVKTCLDRSGLQPGDIDYVHAHGTSTRLNDRSEAYLLQHLFPQGVPVSSTKGATGHSIGASGALGVAFCLLAMGDGVLPPCVGLRDRDFDLDLVETARVAKIDRALCFSFGFGGQNAVVALSR